MTPNTSKNFVYYKVQLKLLSDQLGTCTEVSIYNEHVLKKAQKAIAEANRLKGQVTKALEKYKGTDQIPEDKLVQELQAVVRRYQEVLGKKEEIPSYMEELLIYSDTVAKEFEEMVEAGQTRKATVFMRSEDGRPMISTHMLLGNFKENLKIITNNTQKENRLLPSKVSVMEVMALDVKPVEKFIVPSLDLKRKEDGTPFLLERPIFFDVMGKKTGAIALSEVVPEGAEYTLHLRVRQESPITEEAIRMLLDLGKSNGLGQWRGSGCHGQFVYKLEKVDYDPTPVPKGWN